MSRPHRAWNALKNITIILSLIVNIILIVVVLVLISQIGNIKATLNGVLTQLDTAFSSLGAAVIQDNIHIDQRVPVRFDLPVDQNIVAMTTDAIPLSLPATFSLGSFGQINGTVYLALPPNLALPIHISMLVPVNNEIPVVFDQPVAIPLGERGLGPVIAQLRSVTQPLLQIVRQIPDSIP
ncbi:MAG TPA: hypothetical protein VJG32_18210 [Anaerolineae bacterium]|nr:hypothetical protein [Anaerolineae bacterium]